MPKIHEDEALERLRILREEQARRLKQEQYRYYEPSGKGEEFINLVGNDENFITLFSAANGIGKTAAGCNVLAHILFPNSDNPWFTAPLYKNFPYKKRGRIVSTPTNISINIVPELKRWFPKGRYRTSKKGKQFESVFYTDTGWEIDLMTYEQDPMEFEGVTLGFIWCDEPPPQAIFKALISRLRTGGVMMITATPLAGSAYLYDQFAHGNLTVEIVQPDGTLQVHERKIGYIEADIESACKEHGIRGHLEHNDIMNMVAEYSEDEKQARIYGKFQHLIGLVFKQFNPKVHVIQPFNVTERDFSVWHMLDTHPRHPDAALWVATDRKGTYYVVDELSISAATEEEAAAIKRKDSQFRVVRRLIEPAAAIPNQHDEDGKSLMDRFADHGLSYMLATKQRSQSDAAIADALSYVEIHGEMVKAPAIYIFNTCRQLIWELEHLRWQERSAKSMDTKSAPEKPVDKDDHFIEDLGRFLIQHPQFEPLPPKYERQQEESSLDPYA